MLINQARNLASLPYSSLTSSNSRSAQTQQLLTQAQRIAYNVSRSTRPSPKPIRKPIPARPRRSSSSPTRRRAGRTRSPDSRTPCASRPAWCRISNSTRTQIDGLVSSSQSATGALQAAQAGNQLVALQTKQLADLTAVMAAIARAQSLDGARQAESQAQAQQQLNNFLNYGAGYQPGAAQMFH